MRAIIGPFQAANFVPFTRSYGADRLVLRFPLPYGGPSYASEFYPPSLGFMRILSSDPSYSVPGTSTSIGLGKP